MELKILKYFLTVSKEENITKAAKILFITQPTLSRQISHLEEELGVKLFIRSKYKMILTEEGKLLQKRAEEILFLTEKTKKEISYDKSSISGKISIGCGEFLSMDELAKLFYEFQEKYPKVLFEIYSGSTVEIIEKLENGSIDMGLIFEFVNREKYNFIRMNQVERWGLLVNRNDKLTKKENIKPEDIKNIPLILPNNILIQNEFANWAGIEYFKLDVKSTYTLLNNAAILVKNKIGVAVCLEFKNQYEDLCFIPFYKGAPSRTILAWKHNERYSDTVRKFIKFIEDKK